MPSFGLVQWALIMEMHASEVYEPVRKLRTILLVTVFSTAFVVVLCACPVAHFAVRPITRLKHATERSESIGCFLQMLFFFDANTLNRYKTTIL